MGNVLVKCMQGIGDTIYTRPFVKRLVAEGHQVYIRTVLPELFSDLLVRYVDPVKSTYRTQQKALASSPVVFERDLPEFDQVIDVFYNAKAIRRRSIITHMEHSFGFEVGSTKLKYDLPLFFPKLPAEIGDRKIAVVRPVTVRSEWVNTSRAPDPAYIGWCAMMLRDAGYYVASIADCEDGEEWIEGEEPFAHLKLHRGELDLGGTLGLLQAASVVVGGSGFLVPAAIAAGANLFVIFGGRGQYDNPHQVFDLRMDLKKIGWALPNNFCRCNLMEHDCDKRISDLDDKFMSFMRQIQ